MKPPSLTLEGQLLYTASPGVRRICCPVSGLRHVAWIEEGGSTPMLCRGQFSKNYTALTLLSRRSIDTGHAAPQLISVDAEGVVLMLGSSCYRCMDEGSPQLMQSGEDSSFIFLSGSGSKPSPTPPEPTTAHGCLHLRLQSQMSSPDADAMVDQLEHDIKEQLGFDHNCDVFLLIRLPGE